MGVRADPGRAGQARDQGLGDGDPHAAASERAWSGSAAVRADLGEFLAAQAEGILATDLFTVESVWLKTLYVCFVIELGSRRIRLAAVTRNPDAAWVTQQARNLSFDLTDAKGFRFLIRDRDAKYAASFDAVFASQGIKVIRTPVQAPRSNAVGPGGSSCRWSSSLGTSPQKPMNWLAVANRRQPATSAARVSAPSRVMPR